MEREGIGEREGEGREWGKTGRGMSVCSLSRPVNPKHNPCTCRMMLRCCPAMARGDTQTEDAIQPGAHHCPPAGYEP